jgi:hypothetical protein
MDIQASDGSVEIRLSRAEARRLCTSIAAGYEGVSRAEYFIRTGLSEPAARRIVQELGRVSDGLCSDVVSVPLDAGVEEMENPRKPRPPR